MKFEWETIETCVDSERNHLPYYEETERAKVIGGWIVKTIISYGVSSDGDDWDNYCVTSIFVSDPNHEWSVE